MPFTVFESPIGPLTLVPGESGLRHLYFPGRSPGLDEREGDPRRLADVTAQLEEYFRGERREFDFALEPRGTPFQLRVWQALLEIPYGTTTTYGRLAQRLAPANGSGTTAGSGGRDARAVGAAVGATPVPIVIPCHRVIGADGSLTGYGGGLQRKRALLDFEAAGGDRRALGSSWRQRQLALL